MPTDRVDLCAEDAGAVLALPRAGEQLTDPLRSDTDVHLDELGTRNAEERYACLPGKRLRDQRLPRSRRPVEQNAARNPRAESREPLRIVQELDHLSHLFDRLVAAGNVSDPHAARVTVDGRAPAARRRDVASTAPDEDRRDDHSEPERDRRA